MDDMMGNFYKGFEGLCPSCIFLTSGLPDDSIYFVAQLGNCRIRLKLGNNRYLDGILTVSNFNLIFVGYYWLESL